MAQRRNVPGNIRNMNGRFNVPANVMIVNSVHSAINAFLKSKSKEMRRLINDPKKVPYARSIKLSQDKLIGDVSNYRGLVSLQIQRKVFKRVYQFQNKVNFLLSCDSGIRLNNEFNHILLDTAITTGFIHIVQNFLNAGFDVNSVYNTELDRYCMALHRAAETGQMEIMKLFLQYGADVNLMNPHGKTALFYATELGDLQIVELLLANNAQIYDPDILTASILSKSLDIITLLIKHGVDVNQSDLCGRTPLHFVSGNKRGRRRQSSGFDGPLRAEMARILLNSGAYVDSQATNGITPLHVAALKGYSQVVEILLIHGAAVNMTVSDNKTALFYASHNAYSEVVNVLLKYGADINMLDNCSRSAISIARMSGRTRYAIICSKFKPSIEIRMKYIYLYDNMDIYEPDFCDYDHYEFNTFPYYRERTISLIKKHVVKMIVAKIYVCDEIKSQVDLRAFRSFRNQCEMELANMKNVLLVNQLSGFDIIRMSLDKLAAYTRNPNIRDVLNQYNFPRKFSLYGIIVNGRIKSAIKREEFVTDGCDTLGTVLCLPGAAPRLPFLCTEQIIKYLDNSTINHMVGAFDDFTIE